MLRVKLSFSGQIPGIFYKIKVETGKKVPDCVKEKKKPENPFYWCWCWAWQLPSNENELLLMAVAQDVDTGTCQGQTAEVTAALVK